MKKIVSLLLAVVLLTTMLTVFAVPASAAESYPIKIDPNENTTYSDMTIDMLGKKVSRLFTISGTMSKDNRKYVEFKNVTFKNIDATERRIAAAVFMLMLMKKINTVGII